MNPPRILFVCTHRGARSRIAEEFARRLAPGRVAAQSASFDRGKIGALPVEAMRELGVDLPAPAPKTVFERFKDQEVYDYVVTLCDRVTSEMCPVFLTHVDTLYARTAERLTWSIPDFGSVTGTDDERRAGARRIRDQIKAEVTEFLSRLGIAPEHPAV